MGYHRAGFEVVGVDCVEQPNFPFEFVQGDAIEYLKKNGHLFDAIHASPPCQGFSIATGKKKANYPDLLTPTRELLSVLGKPWVIENVMGAPVDKSKSIVLCGVMFGLKVFRHRYFETSFFLLAPSRPSHDGKSTGKIPNKRTGKTSCSPGKKGKQGFVTVAGGMRDRHYCMEAMGIDWEMKSRELANAIPPAYTEFVGAALWNHVEFSRLDFHNGKQ